MTAMTELDISFILLRSDRSERATIQNQNLQKSVHSALMRIHCIATTEISLRALTEPRFDRIGKHITRRTPIAQGGRGRMGMEGGGRGGMGMEGGGREGR